MKRNEYESSTVGCWIPVRLASVTPRRISAITTVPYTKRQTEPTIRIRVLTGLTVRLGGKGCGEDEIEGGLGEAGKG